MDLRRAAGPLQSETGRRLTRLFRLPSPFEGADGVMRDGSHVHRTANGELVISKSEVIVANTLKALGVDYLYEQALVMSDKTRRLPDFTIHRQSTIYWEHLGMLDRAGYRTNWQSKEKWYADHGIAPWTDGGGPAGTLVWSTEGRAPAGIDAEESNGSRSRSATFLPSDGADVPSAKDRTRLLKTLEAEPPVFTRLARGFGQGRSSA